MIHVSVDSDDGNHDEEAHAPCDGKEPSTVLFVRMSAKVHGSSSVLLGAYVHSN